MTSAVSSSDDQVRANWLEFGAHAAAARSVYSQKFEKLLEKSKTERQTEQPAANASAPHRDLRNETPCPGIKTAPRQFPSPVETRPADYVEQEGQSAAADSSKRKPRLKFTKQHSLTVGDSFDCDSERAGPKASVSLPNVVFHRLVEEQEPWADAADSKAESGKLNISAALPWLAAIFFAVVAVAYLRACHLHQQDRKDPRPARIASSHLQLEQLMTDKRSTVQDCRPLIERFRTDPTSLPVVETIAQVKPQLGIVVGEDQRSVDCPTMRCSLESLSRDASLMVGCALAVFAVALVGCRCILLASRRRHCRQVVDMVGEMTDRPERHDAAKMADGRPLDPFLAVRHVRDALVSAGGRDRLRVCNEAVQQLEENEWCRPFEYANEMPFD